MAVDSCSEHWLFWVNGRGQELAQVKCYLVDNQIHFQSNDTRLASSFLA